MYLIQLTIVERMQTSLVRLGPMSLHNILFKF